MKDSPQTPVTPKSPESISRSVESAGQCIQPQQAVLRSEGLSGVWRIKQNHGPHRDVKAYKPASAEDAKVFLTQISLSLPSRLSKLTKETPKSSRSVKWQGRPSDMPCHGCHGPLGGGAHNGSVTGKTSCTFDHHPSCPGGVMEDASFRPCPPLYVHHPVPDTGFEQTLSSQDFQPPQQTSGFFPVDSSAPPHGAAALNYQTVTEDMQRQMDAHRAFNQGQSVNQDRPSDESLTIKDLRADHGGQTVVEGQMAFLKDGIPALFPAPTSIQPQHSSAMGPAVQSSNVSSQPILGLPQGGQVTQSHPAPIIAQSIGQPSHLYQSTPVPAGLSQVFNSAPPAPPAATQQSQSVSVVPMPGQAVAVPATSAYQGQQQVFLPSRFGFPAIPTAPLLTPSLVPVPSSLMQLSQPLTTGPVQSQAAPQPSSMQSGAPGHTFQQQPPQQSMHQAAPLQSGVPYPGQVFLPNQSQQFVQPAAQYGTPQLAPPHPNQVPPQQFSSSQTGQAGQQLNISNSGQTAPQQLSTPHNSQAFVQPSGTPSGQAVPQQLNMPYPGQAGNPQLHAPFHGQAAPQHGQAAPQQHSAHYYGQAVPQQFAQYSGQTVSNQPGAHQPGPVILPHLSAPQPAQANPHQPSMQSGHQPNPPSNSSQGGQAAPMQTGHQFMHTAAQPLNVPAFQNQVYQPQQFSTPVQSIPVVSAPPPGAQAFSPVYDYFVDVNGRTCKVLRQPQATPPTRTEYRCSPQTGRLYTIQVPVPTLTPPPVKKYEWRCNVQTGQRYQVEVTAPQVPGHSAGQQQQVAQSAQQLAFSSTTTHPQHSQSLPRNVQYGVQPADSSLGQPLPWSVQQGGGHQIHLQPQLHQQPGSPADFDQQLQSKVKGIVQLCEGGVTRKTAKTLDHAKKCSAKWAKKATLENINLPLYTFASVSELESSLAGRSDPLPEGEILAKLRHIKNLLDVCCLNSDQSDFKCYGWTIAKDYALKVEEVVEQKIATWEEMSAGVQTSQLLLAQMDCPKPIKPVRSNVVEVKDGKPPQQPPKARCTTYNACKTEDKCEYELSHPDKKCILKHECSWCKKNLNQSFKHQEWNCKKKN